MDNAHDNTYNNNNNNKQEYFQKKRARYDQAHNNSTKQTQSKPKMKRKQMPQQRKIASNLSAVTTSNLPAVTTSTNTEKAPIHTQDLVVEEPYHEPQPVAHAGRLPLKGDLVEISYAGGAQHDPVRVIHCTYNGDATIRYTDARGANNNVNFLHNRDVTFKITNSVYSAPDINFIPAPRKGDTVELRWSGDGGHDVIYILNVEVEYNEDYDADKVVEEFKVDDEDVKRDINHYDKFNAIMVTFEYPDDKEREKLDFHPNCSNNEILSWKILKCGDTAGLEIGDDVKMDELDNEICTVCCTSFGEFPYRSVVPCAHNNVCAKCTLRMRVFGDFNNDKHPYPMCPFCKESWETVAFVPLSWTISVNHAFEARDSPQNTLSKNEWNTVFAHPLEYDDEIQCYFTDIRILQKFIHIRSLYCLLCNPPNKAITNYKKVYYFHNVGKLLGHIRHDHTSFMCELCINNATLFMDEQRIFRNNKKLLIDHQRNGSAIQGQYGETAPHPFCTLCRRNFYSRESLYEHCEDTHCSCHLCKQSDILEYYANADILSEHHRNLHHLCDHRECLAKLQPVVFDDPLLLKSHQLQVHRMNKPVHNVRTAFTYGDDMHYERGGVAGGTMNFSTMFTQTDINYLSASRYGGNIGGNNHQNAQQMVSIPEEQQARNRQRELHRTMDQIKQRWFPHSFQREQKRKRQQLQLRLKHIPDAVPGPLRDEKNALVIKQIKKTLISELNFKQFQFVSSSFNNNKISSSVFFHRFKGLFDPLCSEEIWVDILIQMLALLRDGKMRRALYEEYRDWVIGGRVNKTTRIRSQYRRGKKATQASVRKGGGGGGIASKKAPQKTNVPSAAAIVAGLYRKPTKAMIMSQRRAQKGAQKGERKRIVSASKPMTTMNVKSKKKTPSSPPNVKGKWKTGAPKMNVKSNKKHKKKDPKIPKVSSKAPAVRQHWPTLAPAKAAPAAPPKWVEEESISAPLVSPQLVYNTPHKKAKTKRGPRKSKKKEKAKMMDVLTPVTPTLTVASQSSTKPKPIIPKMTPKGKMPHEAAVSKNNNKKSFNKSNPWGAPPPKSPPPTRKKQPVVAAEKKPPQPKAKQNKKPKPPQKKMKKKKKKEEIKEEEKEVEAEVVIKKKECYFEFLTDAKSEMQRAFVKLSNFKQTLLANDKVGLFLVFLFECFYSFFEFDFDSKFRYESVELTKAWRQHIYQTVYEQFWSKMDGAQKFDEERIKLKQASFKLRLRENVLRWNPFLYKLPALTENNATQFGALFDMLGAIDDDTMDMSPLKPWIDQMDLRADETYCMLLYLWLILDVELPCAPYKFIQLRKKECRDAAAASNEAKSPKQNNNNKQKKHKQKQNQTESKKKKNNKKQNQQTHKRNKGNKKKQKTKPVVLFKMGGM
eukprot:645278_1